MMRSAPCTISMASVATRTCSKRLDACTTTKPMPHTDKHVVYTHVHTHIHTDVDGERHRHRETEDASVRVEVGPMYTTILIRTLCVVVAT